MSETIKCPICGESMICDQDKNFWRCVVCDCEVWPAIDPMEGWKQVYYEQLKRPSTAKGGGSKGKQKKPRKRPKRVGERYLLK